MRAVFVLLSAALLVLGAPVTLLGATGLLYSNWAPVQPPPNLNEGPGLAGLLGSMMVAVGSASLLLGVAILAALRAAPKPHSD